MAVQPGKLGVWLRTHKKVTIGAPQLGKLLVDLGLPRSTKNAGAWYQLPPEGELESWGPLCLFHGVSAGLPTEGQEVERSTLGKGALVCRGALMRPGESRNRLQNPGTFCRRVPKR